MGQAETLNRVEAEIRFKQDKERSYVVDADGQVVLTKDGDALVICFTEAEMQLMQGKVLTHNHPSGGSFSEEDIDLLLTSLLQEIRAVGSRYKYSMLLPDNPSAIFFERRKRSDTLFNQVRAELLDLMSSNRLSQTEAQEEFMHRIWSQFSRELGLTYQRQRWSDAQD